MQNHGIASVSAIPGFSSYRGSCVDRQGELSEISRFIAEKGVTHCKPVFLIPTSVLVPDEKRRLAELALKPARTWAEALNAWHAQLRRQAMPS